MRRTELERRTPLKRSTELKRTAPKPRRRPISPASTAQRDRVRERACIVCASHPTDPAHLVDRSLGGDDDPRAVVPLCRPHHREYDTGALSLLEHLEPHHREEIAYAVELVGMLSALKRITNTDWRPA